MIAPVTRGAAALSLGRRTRVEPGAMSPHQRAGNVVVCAVLRASYGADLHDIPCMRAIRRDTLESLEMSEWTYGWPTEMIVKALRDGHTIRETDVAFRCRQGGESKVAGRLGPSVRAGARMLAVAFRYT